MKNDKKERLFKAIGAVDDKFIAESERAPSKEAWKNWAAACACVVTALAIAAVLLGENSSVILLPQPSGADAQNVKTSDKYENLGDLLDYLSKNDDHSEDRKSEGNGLGEGTEIGFSALYEGYSYHISCGAVQITRLDGKDSENVGYIKESCDGLVTFGNKLALFSQYSGGVEAVESEKDPKINVKLYSLTQPERPELISSLELSGSLSMCAISGGTLYILHSDGVCACGWSRLGDEAQYLPSVVVNGKGFTCSDEQISILGEPTRVQYTAVSAISSGGDYLGTRAYYGNIVDCFGGEGWLAFSVLQQSEDYASLPVLYCFEINGENIEFTQKTAISEQLGVKSGYRLSDREKSCADIVNVSENDGVLRIVGTTTKLFENNSEILQQSGGMYAITISRDSGNTRCAVSRVDEEHGMRINEIKNTQNAQIISWAVLNSETYSYSNYLSVISYDGMEASFGENATECAYIDGIDGYVSYGMPYGEIETLTALGSGRYARYGASLKKLEIYVLNGDKLEKTISFGELQGDNVYFLESFEMGEGGFAVTVMQPERIDEKKNYFSEKAEEYLYIYKAEGASFELSAKIRIQKDAAIKLFEYDGAWFCARTDREEPDLIA